MEIATIVILAVVAALFVWLILNYNRLVAFKNRTKEAWADIDVQLKRRYDLIPNLMETVKGYAAHEKQVLENVTAARSAAMDAKTPEEKIEKENALSQTLKSLFAVAENYPDLKASANFLELQRELSDTENKIQAARRFYNGNVRDFNIAIESFPSNVVAAVFGFKQMKLFEIAAEAEREVPKVSFEQK
ncbi:MAG TPA: LemA family protein [Candidatus Pacearchaeota archaeon]|nr:LemA family protein [Candidatus Pacearchaeota archaeon]